MSIEAEAAHAIQFQPQVFIALILLATIVAMVADRLRLPYALALVVCGLVVGATGLLPQAVLDPATLFTLMLPPLLFDAAIQLNADALRRDAKPIATYAVAGTLVVTGVVGALVHLALGLPLATALLFGALIAPTDPISVIAVLKRLGVGHRLAMVVEAESLFNDGVAVVLFTVLLGVATGAAISPAGVVGQFIAVLLGGVGVGGAIGWAASRATGYFDDHLLEVMLTTVVAFGAYLAAEALHVSGVMAVVAAGLVVGNIGMRDGMTPRSRLAVNAFWEYAAFMVNSIVFLLIGLEAMAIRWWERPGLVAGGIIIVLVARAVAVYGLAPALRLAGSPVPMAWQHLLFWGGLRGALSMALVLGLPATVPGRDQLVALTFGYVLFSLLVQGTTVGRLVRRLGLAGAPADGEPARFDEAFVLAADAARGALRDATDAGLIDLADEDALAERVDEALLEAALPDAEESIT